MHIALKHKQHHLALDLHSEGGKYRVVTDGGEQLFEAHYLDDTTVLLSVDGRRYRVDLARKGRERLVAIDGEVYTFSPESGGPAAHTVGIVAAPEITAPMPGKVLQVFVSTGDRVAAGDPLLILEAMKMENRLVAEAAGTVAELRVAAGDMVDGGQVLVVLAYDMDA